MFSRTTRAAQLALALALALAATAFIPASHALADEDDYEEYDEHRRAVRLMAGVGAEGGGFVDQAFGLMGGGQVHFGVHIHGFELYGITQGFVGSLMYNGSHSGSATGLLWNSVMFGFGTHRFHIAVGPSLDFAWGCTDSLGSTGCYNSNGPLFGVDVRLALQFGEFELSVNVHPTFYGKSTVTAITVGVGWAY